MPSSLHLGTPTSESSPLSACFWVFDSDPPVCTSKSSLPSPHFRVLTSESSLIAFESSFLNLAFESSSGPWLLCLCFRVFISELYLPCLLRVFSPEPFLSL